MSSYPSDVIFPFQPAMLSCHLRSISRLRSSVFRLDVSKLTPSTVRTNTARFLSVSSVRNSDASKTGNSELDLLLGVGDKTASEASELLTKDTNELIVDIPAVAQHTAPPSEIFNESAATAFSTDIVDFTNLVEPSFASLGLGHGWPSGWMQSFMEFLHIDVGNRFSDAVC